MTTVFSVNAQRTEQSTARADKRQTAQQAMATIVVGSLNACVPQPALGRLLVKTLKAAWGGHVSTLGLREITVQLGASLVMMVASVAATVSSDYSWLLYFRF